MSAEPSPPRAARGGALHAILGLGVIQAMSMAAGIGRAKILALFLGVAGFGVTAVIDSAVAFLAQLGSFSIPMAATRFLPTRRAESADAFGALYRALSRTLAGASLVVAAIACTVAYLRPEAFGEGLAEHRNVLLIAILTVPAVAFAPFLRSVMALLGRHRAAAWSVFWTGVTLVLSSYIGLRAGGLPGLFVGNLVVGLGAVILMRLFLVRDLDVPGRLSWGMREALRREEGLFVFMTGMHLLTLAAPLAYLYARVRVLTEHGEAAAGLLAAAYGVALAARVVLNQGNALYLAPLVNQPTSKAHRASAVGDYLHVLTVLFVLGALALCLFPREVLALLYSSRFEPAVPLVGAFLLGEGIMLGAAVLQALLIGYGDLRAHLTNTVIGQVVVAIGVHFLVPPLGALGAASSFVIGHSVIFTLTAASLVRRHDAAAAVRGVTGYAIALALVALIAWWVVATGPGVGAKALVYVVLGGSAVAYLRPDERRRLLAPWRALASSADAER